MLILLIIIIISINFIIIIILTIMITVMMMMMIVRNIDDGGLWKTEAESSSLETTSLRGLHPSLSLPGLAINGDCLYFVYFVFHMMYTVGKK